MIDKKHGMITEHFSWEEAFHTNHREIENMIPDESNEVVFANISRAATKLEKVRALLGVPLLVSSWYRCPELNAAVGGAKNSDHMTGNAIDFIAPQFGMPVAIAKKIAENASIIGFKQLILEHTWIHISFPAIPGTPAKLEVLSLVQGGKYATGLTDKFGKPLA